MKKDLDLPSALYKYQSFNFRSINNLKNAQIFFSRPKDFNDPFDCSLIAESFKYNDKDIINFYNHSNSSESFFQQKITPKPNMTVKSIENVPDGFKNMVDKGLKEFAQEKDHQNLYNKGCCCFSELKNNLLMWSHYTDGHKGFCLEFDTSFKPFDKALKVKYSAFFPKINPIDIVIQRKTFDSRILVPLLTKFTCWNYEKEWRIFHHESRKLYKYEAEAIKAAYFGVAAKNPDIKTICLILQNQNPNVRFFKAVKSKNKFKIEFESLQNITK